MTNKTLLVASIVSFVTIFLLGYVESIFFLTSWYRGLESFFSFFGNVFAFIASLLPFALVMSKMKEAVFQSWWRFARWFVPAMIAVFFLNDIQIGNISFDAARNVEFFTVIIFYPLFFLTSFGVVFFAYRNTKDGL